VRPASLDSGGFAARIEARREGARAIHLPRVALTRCGSFRLPWAFLFNGFAVPRYENA